MGAKSWRPFALAGLLIGLGCVRIDPRDFQPRPAKVLKSGAITTAEVTFEKALGVPDSLQQEATEWLRAELGLVTPEAKSPGGPRLLRIRFLSLGPRTFPRPDLAGQWFASALAGAALGAGVGLQPGGTLAIGAAVGGVVGFAAGPFFYRESKALERRLGYLPWAWSAELEILAVDGTEQKRLTRKEVLLMPKPYYEALPPDRARDPSQVRSATVRGVLVAFARDVKSWRAVE